MTPEDPSRARRLAALRWVTFAFALLMSAAAVAAAAFAVSLLVTGFSGGSNPESINALAIPIAVVVILAGAPVALVCALAWLAYSKVTRRARPPR
jgi:hypothetical protein